MILHCSDDFWTTCVHQCLPKNYSYTTYCLLKLCASPSILPLLLYVFLLVKTITLPRSAGGCFWCSPFLSFPATWPSDVTRVSSIKTDIWWWCHIVETTQREPTISIHRVLVSLPQCRLPDFISTTELTAILLFNPLIKTIILMPCTCKIGDWPNLQQDWPHILITPWQWPVKDANITPSVTKLAVWNDQPCWITHLTCPLKNQTFRLCFHSSHIVIAFGHYSALLLT